MKVKDAARLRRQVGYSPDDMEKMRAARRNFTSVLGGAPSPPSPIAKELWAKGTIPIEGQLADKLLLLSSRCGCGHITGAHRLGGLGRCEAKKCPCLKYSQNPEYRLPVWNIANKVEIVPAPAD